MGSQASEGSAAMAGQGVAILTRALFAAELADGRLVQPFDLVGDDGHAYWLVYPEAAPQRSQDPRLPRMAAGRDRASVGTGNRRGRQPAFLRSLHPISISLRSYVVSASLLQCSIEFGLTYFALR